MTTKPPNPTLIGPPPSGPAMRSRRRQSPGPVRPAPIQLPLFPERIALTRIRPEMNERRYYQIEILSDLFGRVVLARHWGRIGRSSRTRLVAFADLGSAIDALAALANSKRRRGYQVHHGG